jgi:hypothetical protein
MASPLPTLSQSLSDKDLGYLRIIAGFWGLEISDPDHALEFLEQSLLQRERAAAMLAQLPPEALQALADLQHSQGWLYWPLFTRRYGAVRAMGAGKRDRERPYLRPDSPAEALWYRGLLGRAFMNTPDGPQEFAFIPSDLLALLPALPPAAAGAAAGEALGRAATLAERAHPIPASDRILDHACTLLAALRLELAYDSPEFTRASWDKKLHLAAPPAVLQALLGAAGLLDAKTRLPLPEQTRRFLDAPRAQALALLTKAWLESAEFNELRQLPHLVAEGEWQNEPRRARAAVLALLAAVPKDAWWSLDAFQAAVRQAQPDFQRPAGDYDSWYLRDQASGEYLRGFEHWDEVDGALLRYIITGPLHWLGIIGLAAPEPGKPPSAFRFSTWATPLLSGEPPPTLPRPGGLPLENEPVFAASDAHLRVPRLAPRSARYIIARFGHWEGMEGDAYVYRLTPASMQRAQNQELTVTHLRRLLERHSRAVPPSLFKALERWFERGVEARLEPALVLRVRVPEALTALRGSPAARYLDELLSPTAVTVRPGAAEKVLAALAELGYLGEGEF